MVERFNKTLASMLRAYVGDHQRDWDTHLPYLMMAYRSDEHETTGCTPNSLMLGREVATPMDAKWVGSCTAKPLGMGAERETRYHDAKLNWERFIQGDQVFVFFPTRKVGNSSKLTRHWRGPYQILRRISDLLYEVNCGSRGKPQVTHVDRLHPLKPKFLSNEILQEEKVSSEEVADDESECQETEDTITNCPDSGLVNGRRHRPPHWHEDYVLY